MWNSLLFACKLDKIQFLRASVLYCYQCYNDLCICIFIIAFSYLDLFRLICLYVIFSTEESSDRFGSDWWHYKFRFFRFCFLDSLRFNSNSNISLVTISLIFLFSPLFRLLGSVSSIIFPPALSYSFVISVR